MMLLRGWLIGVVWLASWGGQVACSAGEPERQQLPTPGQEVRQTIDPQLQRFIAAPSDLDAPIGHADQTREVSRNSLDRFWLLMAAILVCLMQVGFLCREMGMVRRQHAATTALKSLLGWLVLCSVFFLFGFALMHGTSFHGLLGTSLFAPTVPTMAAANPRFGCEFFLFQLALASTAATIALAAMAERAALVPCMITVVFVGGLIYPLIGHWAWGMDFGSNLHHGVATGWLKRLGFLDFAGSTVVHCVGAWIALWGVRQVGPRAGRFSCDGSVNEKPFVPYSLGCSMFGVFIIVLGWWGNNGGNALRYDPSVASIILNSNLAAAAGGLVAFLITAARDSQRSFVQLIGGTLGGLVSVTANCDRITSLDAILIGSMAGVLYYLAFHLLLKLRLDDPVGAIAVHGACGVWGTLAVAVFGDHLSMSRWAQFGVQVLGITTVFVAVSLPSYLFFALLDRFGIRVSRAEEREGVALSSGRQLLARAEVPALIRATGWREISTIARINTPREIHHGRAGNTMPLVD